MSRNHGEGQETQFRWIWIASLALFLAVKYGLFGVWRMPYPVRWDEHVARTCSLLFAGLFAGAGAAVLSRSSQGHSLMCGALWLHVVYVVGWLVLFEVVVLVTSGIFGAIMMVPWTFLWLMGDDVIRWTDLFLLTPLSVAMAIAALNYLKHEVIVEQFHRRGAASMAGAGAVGLIVMAGLLVLAPPHRTRSSTTGNRLFPVCKEKCGYIDLTGQLVIGLQFEGAHHFSEGLAHVKQAGKWGYIDHSGSWIIPPRFKKWYSDGAYQDFCPHHFSDGLALQPGFGYIDKTGAVAISPRYWWARQFSEGLAAVQVDKKYGYLDTRGEMVIKPTYDMAEDFSEGLAVIGQDGVYGYIDKTGVLAIPATFNQAFPFSEGLAKIRIKEGLGYINKQGEVVIQPTFVFADSFSEDLAAVEVKPFMAGYIDRTGRFVVPPQFRNAQRFTEGLAAVQDQQGKWRYIDRSGRTIIQTDVDSASPFSEGLAEVRMRGLGDKVGYIDKLGRYVWKPTR